MPSLAAAAVAPVTTPQPALSTAPAARSLEPEPKGYDQKEMERVIQVLDWPAENFISKNNRVPTLEELRAWKDPDFPFPFREWPKPPPGKKWVMDKNSGQFRLAQQ